MGSSGSNAAYQRKGANTGLASTEATQSLQNDPRLASIMSQYGSGGMSYQDAIKASQGFSANTSDLDAQIAEAQKKRDTEGDLGGLGRLQDVDNRNQDTLDQLQAKRSAMGAQSANAIGDALASGSLTGNKLASDQVMNDSLYSGLFGEKGLGAQAQNNYTQGMDDYSRYQGEYDKGWNDYQSDRDALSGKDSSYGLTPEDLAAYGQASDQAARMFGSQGQSLSSMLADRGLGASRSGVATQGFSNLMGNQMEQLRNAQMSIAQNRINTAQGLAQSRMNATLQAQGQRQAMAGQAGNQANAAGNLALGVGNLGKAAQGQYYNQNLAGMQQRQGNAESAAKLAMSNTKQNQDQANEEFSQQQQSSGDMWGALAGSALGAGVGAFTGGMGTALGASAGQSLGGKPPVKK